MSKYYSPVLESILNISVKFRIEYSNPVGSPMADTVVTYVPS